VPEVSTIQKVAEEQSPDETGNSEEKGANSVETTTPADVTTTIEEEEEDNPKTQSTTKEKKEQDFTDTTAFIFVLLGAVVLGLPVLCIIYCGCKAVIQSRRDKAKVRSIQEGKIEAPKFKGPPTKRIKFKN